MMKCTRNRMPAIRAYVRCSAVTSMGNERSSILYCLGRNMTEQRPRFGRGKESRRGRFEKETSSVQHRGEGRDPLICLRAAPCGGTIDFAMSFASQHPALPQLGRPMTLDEWAAMPE